MDQSKTEETKIQIAFELLKGLITDNRYGYKDLKALPELAALMASNLVNAVASTNGGPALPVGTIITVRGNDTEEDDALSHLILTENGWEPCPPRKSSFHTIQPKEGDRKLLVKEDGTQTYYYYLSGAWRKFISESEFQSI